MKLNTVLALLTRGFSYWPLHLRINHRSVILYSAMHLCRTPKQKKNRFPPVFLYIYKYLFLTYKCMRCAHLKWIKLTEWNGEKRNSKGEKLVADRRCRDIAHFYFGTSNPYLLKMFLYTIPAPWWWWSCLHLTPCCNQLDCLSGLFEQPASEVLSRVVDPRPLLCLCSVPVLVLPWEVAQYCPKAFSRHR